MASYNTLPIYFESFKIFYYHFYVFSPQILNELCAGHNSVRAGNTSIDKIMLVGAFSQRAQGLVDNMWSGSKEEWYNRMPRRPSSILPTSEIPSTPYGEQQSATSVLYPTGSTDGYSCLGLTIIVQLSNYSKAGLTARNHPESAGAISWHLRLIGPGHLLINSINIYRACTIC